MLCCTGVVEMDNVTTDSRNSCMVLKSHCLVLVSDTIPKENDENAF